MEIFHIFFDTSSTLPCNFVKLRPTQSPLSINTFNVSQPTRSFYTPLYRSVCQLVCMSVCRKVEIAISQPFLAAET